MLFVQAFFPLIDGLTSLALTGFETVKAYLSVKITKYNKQIKEMTQPSDSVKNKIGFIQEEDDDDIL